MKHLVNKLVLSVAMPLVAAGAVVLADEEAELAQAAALPDTQSQRKVIGPQPGPDRPLKKMENPFREDENAINDGRRLFVWFNCSGCHGGRAGGGMGPSLRDAAWLYGNNSQDIFNSISEGRSLGMPAWGTKLPVEQIWKLTAYVESLDTELEPDPPPKNPVFPDPPPRRDIKGVQAGGGQDESDD